VYALGCVLFFLLSGRVPYEGSSQAARIYAHLEQPVPPVPGASQELSDVVRRAMAKDPADRHATAGKLAEAAQAAVDLGGRRHAVTRTAPVATAVRPAAATEKPAGPWRRRGTALAVAVLATCVAGALGAVALSRGGDAGEDAGLLTAPPESTSETGAVAPATVTVTATTPAPSRHQPDPEPAAALASWPASQTGWTVVLRSAGSRSSAETVARRALESYGGAPGVVHSSEFASLRPGYWIAFAGRFDSRADAEAALPRYRNSGFGSAYVRLVANGTAAASFNTGRSSGERYSAAQCRVDEGILVCWTPNDGYTLALDDAGARRLRSAEPSNRGRDPESTEVILGERWERPGFSCRSTQQALTCENQQGRGFRLPRYRGLPTFF
jgi:hypothetical protein